MLIQCVNITIIDFDNLLTNVDINIMKHHARTTYAKIKNVILDTPNCADKKFVSAHQLVAWDRSQLVMGRHDRRRCDIFCVTVTHCDVEFFTLSHRVFKIYFLESYPKYVYNFDTFEDHNDDNCQKFWGAIFLK